MRIKMNNTLSFIEVDKLIERYYEGQTTGEEEKQLADFLSQPNLPERYDPERAILGYFNPVKQKHHFHTKLYISWISVAAVILSAVFVFPFLHADNHNDYAIVDGIKITDIREVKSQALASLIEINAGQNEMEESFKNLNSHDLIKDQLDVFSGLE